MKTFIQATRRNHALEHATVAVLMERGSSRLTGGYSTPTGFYIFGKFSTESVGGAAYEALCRLNDGQSELAISPFCGTNHVTRTLLAGALTSLLMRQKRKGIARHIPALIAGLVAAATISRPIGNALQQRYTTLNDPSSQKIINTVRIWTKPFTLHKINVAQIPSGLSSAS